MLSEARHVQGCRSYNNPQIWALRQNTLEVTEQKVHIQTTLVSFVDNQCIVLLQQAIPLQLRQQDAIGHQFYRRTVRRLIAEAYLEPNQLTESRVQFLSNAICDCSRRQASGLGVSDRLVTPTTHFEADLGQLRRFTRPCLAGYDSHRVFADRSRQFLATS